MELTRENCPDVNDQRRDAINALSDEELTLEIEKGAASRFGSKMQPILRTAQRLREQEEQTSERNEELEIAREANRIAEKALDTAKESKFWSAIAVLISAITALIIYFSS